MTLKEWIAADKARTQQKLADACGVEQSTIARIVAGGSCSAALMRAIHDATEGAVTPNDLVLG